MLEQQIAWQSDDGTQFITEPHGWYRLVTSGFLHFGIVHIGLNMFFLWVLGPMLEPALGRVRFILLYLASLLGGSLGVILLDKGGISAGASGAVFGLLAAAAIGQWRRGINPLTTGIGATLLMNLVITFAIPGISIGGHIGGIVAGSICGAVMLAPAYQERPDAGPPTHTVRSDRERGQRRVGVDMRSRAVDDLMTLRDAHLRRIAAARSTRS